MGTQGPRASSPGVDSPCLPTISILVEKKKKKTPKLIDYITLYNITLTPVDSLRDKGLLLEISIKNGSNINDHESW